ncbi:hypothetical protein [Actinoplanes solisilvae]|uniref:hypothetical protein n=1 Tax=Actinoplanes solisilvae TaxID=2486853 RepID=UPI000FDB48B2|nr:hypothetical protein [Actinoplanes solisilvae]
MRTSGRLIAAAALCTLGAAATWFIGIFSGSSTDPKESCHAVGATYDEAYRATHWREPSRFFPLHNRCNADHDLVAPWINPTLALLTLLAATCLAVAIGRPILRRLVRSPEG